jgi:hypothetical protein
LSRIRTAVTQNPSAKQRYGNAIAPMANDIQSRARGAPSRAGCSVTLTLRRDGLDDGRVDVEPHRRFRRRVRERRNEIVHAGHGPALDPDKVVALFEPDALGFRLERADRELRKVDVERESRDAVGVHHLVEPVDGVANPIGQDDREQHREQGVEHRVAVDSRCRCRHARDITSF